ncbi:MAG: radical SAM protein [Oscillospiraceae bacterium]|nr:radical SAM protein [Oscillospiraceae bacterium]MBP1575114.1 radical SAM protein [Oscillospiraceae bacterium]
MKHANVAFFVPMVGCPHRCSFCDQNSITGESGVPTPEEVDKTLKKAARELHGFSEKAEIAFFGGSFTMIPRELMESLLSVAKKWIDRKAFSGIRISTRPDAIDEEVLAVLKEYGVTSIELGAQSCDNEVLLKNRRGHTFEDTQRASELIKNAGFSLGLQMMTGMPGSTKELDVLTAARFAALKPETMRIYPTLVLKNTLLAKWFAEGEFVPQTVEEAAAECAELLDVFELYNIKVIRLGLHAEESLEENLVAGPYHPAFREICESLRFRKKIAPMLTRLPKGSYVLKVAPSEVSKCSGQKKSNIEHWLSLGYAVKITPDKNLNPGDFEVMMAGM